MTSAFQQLVDIFLNFYKDHKEVVIMNVLFLFLYPLQDILLPHFYGRLMDNLSEGNFSDVNTTLIIVVSLLAFVQVMFMISDIHNAKVLPMMESYIRSYLVKNILNKYEEQHEELEVGEIITKIIKIPGIIAIWFDRIKSYIIPYMLVYLFAAIYFWFIDWQIAIAFIVTVLIMILVFLKAPYRCSDVSKTRDDTFNDIHKQIDDVLSNLFSIYGSGQQQTELNRLQAFSTAYAQQYKETMHCALGNMIIMNPIIIVFIIFFVWKCKFLLETKQIKVSSFISMFIIFLYVLGSILIINDQLRDIIFEWGMIDSSADMLAPITTQTSSKSIKMVSPSRDVPAVPTIPGIGLSHVSFKYPGSDKLILRDISIHVHPGERVCLVGDIGSGKSTIIKLMLKYHTPTSGYVYYNAIPYERITVKELRSKIGYVPQTPILFNRSVLDNILYGNKTHTRNDVEHVMRQFGLEEEFVRLEKGLDTIVGKNGSKLSGGQRQLVWCIRVLMYNPDVLILDEPTASVDEKIKQILHTMLNVLMRGKTVIMITHDPYLESIATRIIKIHEGNVTSTTPTTDIKP